MTHTDETTNYEKETENLLLNYVDYMKGIDLKKVQIKTIPLAVDNGTDTAKSYWNAEYVDGGVKITVDVIDEYVSIDESSNGYSDNVELQMQAVDNIWQTKNYTFNFLCDASGRYWAKRYDGNNYVSMQLQNDPTLENNELYYAFTITEEGYHVELFVSYDVLNVTSEEALGNVRICPMLRNRTNETYNVFECSSLLGCYYYTPTSWFVLNNNNRFVHSSIGQFALASRNEHVNTYLSELATLQAEEGAKMAKTEIGAHAYATSNWGIDGLASELLDKTDYLLGGLNGKATVKEAGYAIICVQDNNSTMLDKMNDEGWILIADKCRTALNLQSSSGRDFRITTSYYTKYLQEGETIETTGTYSLMFGKHSQNTEEAAYKIQPAYVSFSAVDDEFYMEDANVNTCCPSIAVTKSGRLFACYMTGGENEPKMENCAIMQYSDDGGCTWKRLFVVDTWKNEIIGGSKQTVLYDLELRYDNANGKLYVSYCLRKNIDNGITMDTQTWMFTISNPDSDLLTEEMLNISEHENTGMGGVQK